MLLRFTAVKTSLVAAMRLGSWRTSAERACVSCLRRCDERTRVNTCVIKSLFQELESSPVIFLVMSPHLLFCQTLSWKFEVSCLSKCIRRQPKIGCNTPRAIWLCFCPKIASETISEHPISKIFVGEHAPRPP